MCETLANAPRCFRNSAPLLHTVHLQTAQEPQKGQSGGPQCVRDGFRGPSCSQSPCNPSGRGSSGDLQQWTVGAPVGESSGGAAQPPPGPSPQPHHRWARIELSTCRKTQAALQSQSHSGPAQHPLAESWQRAETPDPGGALTQQGAEHSSNVRAASHRARGPRDPQGLLALSLQDLPAESQPPGCLGQSPQRGMPSLPRCGPGSTLRPGCLRPRPRPPACCPWCGSPQPSPHLLATPPEVASS